MGLLADIPPVFLRVFAVTLGLLWGSFLNVVIYRVPRGESVVSPPSHCPHCGTPIAPWDNIPVLSWLLLRGRSRCCHQAISPRYMAVELLGGVLSLAVLESTVLVLPSDTPMSTAAGVYVSGFVFAMALTAIAFIDMEHLIVPDRLALALAVIGLGTWWMRPELTIGDALLSALGGYLLVWLLFGVVYRAIRGRTGMGLGDALLLLVAGAWFGWKGMLFALLAGSVQGTVIILLTFLAKGQISEPDVVKREREELEHELESITDPEEREALQRELAHDPVFEDNGDTLGALLIPFGPFLALAMLEYLMVGAPLMERYMQWLILP